MDHLTHDDGSFKLNELRHEVNNILQYLDDRSNPSNVHVELEEVMKHTFGENQDDSLERPFDEWMETIRGADERISNLGARLNEISEEVAEQDDTYDQVYQETAEFIFTQLEEATD
jgi:hypothetical protein